MFKHYLELAIRSFKRDVTLTALMVLAIGIGIGIGASMTSLTVYHVLAQDPYPGRGNKLYRPQLDPRRANDHYVGGGSNQDQGEPYLALSWADGMALLHAKRADRQTLVGTGGFRVESAQPGSPIETQHPYALYVATDFFGMFGAPFRFGHPWSAADEEHEARIVIISSKLNDRFFGGVDSVGQTLLLNNVPFQIAGVLAPWNILPRIYGSFDAVEFTDSYDAYLPLTTAMATQMHRSGTYYCWDRKVTAGSGSSLKSAPCAWLAMWVELDSPDKAASYRDFLTHYSLLQKAQGRFERQPNIRLNRPGIELTPRSWTVTIPPMRLCLSAGTGSG